MRHLFLFCARLSVMAFLAVAGLGAALGLGTTPLYALNAQTWVASNGNDAHACTRDAPCQTFQGALANTAGGGKVSCVDSGDFGAMVITQSVTIDCTGAQASISNNYCPLFGNGSCNSINIGAGASDIVILRGLSIVDTYEEFSPVDANGIYFASGAALYVIDCVIGRYYVPSSLPTGNGILFTPSGAAELHVENSHILANGQTSPSAGININPASGVMVNVTVDGSTVEKNINGIAGDGRSGGTIRVTVSNSVVSGNTVNGIAAVSSGSSVAFLVDQTKVTGNSVGLYANGSGAGMAARNTSIFNNVTGLESVNGGKLVSFGNNSVIGNPTAGAFTGMAALE